MPFLFRSRNVPDIVKVIKIIKLCTHITLENGGETYRAEDIAVRTAQGLGMKDIEVLAIPTGVFITLTDSQQQEHTIIKRVKKRTVNLYKLDEVNTISRKIINHELDPDEAIIRLEELVKSYKSKKWVPVAAAALSSGFFAIMLGGSWFDFPVAVLCGCVVQYIASSFKRDDLFHFIISLLGGMIISAIAIAATTLTGMGKMEMVIAGAMMPLLPGLLMTNAIRDTMHGDLVSGVAKGAEAVLVSIALAAGVGITLWLYLIL
jgi:uncharacterized membrane protein YjjP (DUF1212 family)